MALYGDSSDEIHAQCCLGTDQLRLVLRKHNYQEILYRQFDHASTKSCVMVQTEMYG